MRTVAESRQIIDLSVMFRMNRTREGMVLLNGAFDTVKDTVVGEGRRVFKRVEPVNIVSVEVQDVVRSDRLANG